MKFKIELIFLLVPFVLFSQYSGSDNWDLSLSGPHGPSGKVYCISKDNNGNIYVGGDFLTAGGIDAANIAMWDGSTWNSLGEGLNGSVYAMAFDGNGNLYVGGSFTMAGSTSVNHIAMWDGMGWHALSTGANNTVYAIAFDNSGTLYIGGKFTNAGSSVNVNYIAQWDGSSWLPVGAGFNNYVYVLKFDNNNVLYAGGSFTESASTILNRIAKWDDVSWQPIGDGVDNTVRAISFDNYSRLYIGGSFRYSGTTLLNHIAYWNGSSWSSLGNGTNNDVKVLVNYNNRIYIGGSFTSVDGSSIAYLASWDGSSFHYVENFNNEVTSLYNDGSNILVGGAFTLIGTTPITHFGIYDGVSWSKIGLTDNGLNDEGYAVAYDSLNDVLYIGGRFTSASGIVVNQIVKWDGHQFHTIGNGFNGAVNSIAIDSYGNVYAGGSFTMAGSTTVNHVAKWNGAVWQSLGSGVNDEVYSLYCDHSGNLYVGGKFTNSSGVNTPYFSKWNGSSWSSMGDFDGFVYSISSDNNGNIYVGGDFSIVNGIVVNHIAKLSYSSWSSLGNGVNNIVRALAVDTNNFVFAGGDFTFSGSMSLKYIAFWDGTSWNSLGSGANAPVYSLKIDRNNFLYAGGKFTSIGSANALYLSKWANNQWELITSGTDNIVRDIDLSNDGRLFITGEFTMANSHSSAYFAEYKFYPDIKVYGNNELIINNDTTVSEMDNTDFGDVRACDTSITKRFVLYNNGNWPLNIDSIFIAGNDSSLFHLQFNNQIISVGDSLPFFVTFGPSDIGIKNAQIVIYSNSKNDSIHSFSIRANSIDTLVPIVYTQSVDLFLDSTGSSYLTNGDIVTYTHDNCTILDTLLSKYSFNCSDTFNSGIDTIIVSVRDEHNNIFVDSVLVTLHDTIMPILNVLTSYDAYIDTNGLAVLRPSDVVSYAYDNCFADTLLSIDTFDCSYIDSVVNVAVTLIDAFGNIDSQNVSVLVKDTITPWFTLNDTTMALNEFGFVVLLDTVFLHYAYDNCSIEEIQFSRDTLYCNDVGINQIDISISDVSGNTYQTTVSINLIDTLSPIFSAKDTLVYLDENGEYHLDNLNVIDSVITNCPIVDTIYTPPILDCSNIGANTVNVQLVDVHNNSSSKTIIIHVVDTLGPVPDVNTLPDIIEQCSASVSPPTATDNCGQNVTGVTKDSTYYDQQGTYYIQWQYYDANNNVTYQTQRVIIDDNIAPQPVVDSLPTLYGLCTYSVEDVPIAIDNCSGEILGTTTDTLFYNMPGQYLINWIYTDAYNNQSQQPQIIEVSNEPPVAITKDITVMLNVYGYASITPEDIDDGSFDDCNIVSMELDKYDFTLSDLGENVVTLYVKDDANNVSSSPATVTIIKYPDLQIPNFISPNGDGVNDIWEIIGIDNLIGYKLYIYDQTNNLVYKADMYRNDWDGTSNGKILPNGTYYYIFVKDNKRISGYITIIR